MPSYKLPVIAVGDINIITGETDHGWSIYNKPTGQVYLSNHHLLYSAPSGLKKGDRVFCYDNDSLRKTRDLSDVKIEDTCAATQKDVLKMLLDNGFDYYPLKAFQKRVNKNRLLGGYSIKGIESVDSKKEKELKDVKVGDPCKLLWAGKWNNATVTSIEGNMVFWQLDNGKFHGSSNYTRDSGIKIEESIQFSSVRESNYSLERRLRRLEATVGVSNRKQTKSRMSESYRNGYKYFSNEEIRGMNSSTFSEIGNAYDYWCEENDGRPEAEDLIEMLDGVSESEIHRFLDNVEY